ncbi:MAG: sulfotransferase domain-containing protein [Xanthobacteraceae bacterium]
MQAETGQRAGQLKPGIVWLASYPRSGNTWTRHFLHNLLRVLDGNDSVPQDINALGEYTLWDVAGQRFERLLGKALDAASRTEIAAARVTVQQQIADDADAPVFVKTHNMLALDRGHPTINMGATSGAIYIIRNPLDVVISFAHHFGVDLDTAIDKMSRRGLETDITEHASYEVYGSWSENVMSWTRKPHRAIYVIRYEDMLERPLEMFRGLCRHLLLDPSETQLTRAIDLSSFEQAKTQEVEKGYRERPKQSKVFFRAGHAGQWRQQLSHEQISRVVTQHREQMARFGYVPEAL